MTPSSLDRETILHAIESWPVEDQVGLARTILLRARIEDDATTQPARSTWDALYGIASSGQEPPSDEQVAQWLDERKMEKYGR